MKGPIAVVRAAMVAAQRVAQNDNDVHRISLKGDMPLT
jgi:hypothetical protein